MLNTIKTNLNVLEYMNFIWQSVMDREVVSETYFHEVANLPDMRVLYDEEFKAESVRKVLSAICNKELLNTQIVKEKQYWNNNMMATEDRGVLEAMIQPIKSLNLDGIKDNLNAMADIPYNEIEVVFIPAIKEESFQNGNRLFINFFKIMVDVFGGTGEVTIMGKSPAEYVQEKVLAMEGVVLK